MKRLMLALGLLSVVGFATPAAASLDCDDLYVLRNSFYRAKGLCFTRRAAIRRFGNAGCKYDSSADLPLSLNEKKQIDRILAAEESRGCGRDGSEW